MTQTVIVNPVIAQEITLGVERQVSFAGGYGK